MPDANPTAQVDGGSPAGSADPRSKNGSPAGPPPWRLLAIAAALVALAAAVRGLGLAHSWTAAQEWIASLGPVGMLAYGALFALGVVLFVPGTMLTLSAGALFGTVRGIAVVSVAGTLGACICFLLARFAARDAVARWMAGSERLRRLDERVEANAVLVLLVTRICPIVPGNVYHYAYGLTRVRFSVFTFWSWLGMLPGTILYVTGIDSLKHVLTGGRVPWPMLALLAASAVVVALLLRWASRRQA